MTSTVLAMFNSVTRPDVMNWYAKTKFYHIVELTTWQVLPSEMTFARLHERYRPSSLQLALQGQYPCVVDWVPFASIRDRLIRLHAANPLIDQIFCDAVSAYVVETTLSSLVAAAPNMRVYLRVTDLVASMARNNDDQEAHAHDTNLRLPAPDVQSIFSSPTYAYLAFKHLRMDCGASNYKMDPVFFAKYAELCDPDDDIMASGVPLKPEKQTTLTRPIHLDSLTIETYYNFINFAFGAASTVSAFA
jgi:hypothetical protein